MIKTLVDGNHVYIKKLSLKKIIYLPVTTLPLASVTGTTDCVTGFPLASIILKQFWSLAIPSIFKLTNYKDFMEAFQ